MTPQPASGMPNGEPLGDAPIVTENAGGRGRVVILCDHASNRIPAEFGDLGLDAKARRAHIAWDPGALGVSRHLSAALDAPLVFPDVSRLVIDCNRDVSAPDLVPAVSETTQVPGNQDLDAAARARRIALSHAPFHARVEALLEARAGSGIESIVVSIHTFTPVYKGVSRPWPVGILSNHDRRLADAMRADLAAQSISDIGDNEPYAPRDGVYYTLHRHGERRGLACAMVEIRNDEVADPAGERLWGERLARALRAGEAALVERGARNG
jgi:predicted N-formylglutamate amidohydrolase